MAHGLLAVGADGRLLDAPLRDVVLADVAEFLQLQAVAHTEVLGIQASGLEAAQVDTGMPPVAEVDESHKSQVTSHILLNTYKSGRI